MSADAHRLIVFTRYPRPGEVKTRLIPILGPQGAADLLCGAFRALERGDVVLGPAEDGGYYLVGLRRPAPRLFADMRWGTSDVRRRTLERACCAARRARRAR